MLSRLLSKRFSIIYRGKARFGAVTHDHHESDHHDHHDHHDYSVHIDKETPWIKYKSDPRLACIYGVQDTNYKLQPLLKSEPFEHLKNQPFFSWNRMVYNDPWFHDDSHEPYNSAPERGYINGEDPLQTRSFYSTSLFVSISIVMILFTMLGAADKDVTYGEVRTSNELTARAYVINTLEQRNKTINQLRAREAELLQGSQ